jgi:hypothetical protein
MNIELRSGATSLFDVQRSTFNVGRSSFTRFNVGCSMLDVHVFNWTFNFQNHFVMEQYKNATQYHVQTPQINMP